MSISIIRSSARWRGRCRSARRSRRTCRTAWTARRRSSRTPPAAPAAPRVTESRGLRACSCYSIRTGMQTAHPPAVPCVPCLTPASKSVLYSLCSVKSVLYASIQCPKMSYTLYVVSESVLLTRSPCFSEVRSGCGVRGGGGVRRGGVRRAGSAQVR